MFSLVFNDITKLAKHYLTLDQFSHLRRVATSYLNLQNLVDKIIIVYGDGNKIKMEIWEKKSIWGKL